MKQNRRNFYRILHVQQDAPVEIIKASYRTCMQKLRAHPDLGGDEWNAALLNEALSVLSNPEKRRRYDRQLSVAQTFERNIADTEKDKSTVTREQPASSRGQYTVSMEACSFCGAPVKADFQECLRCQSPLTHPTAAAPRHTDQRAFKRLDYYSPIEVCQYWPQDEAYPGHIQNLTPHGLMIVLKCPLVTGRVIRLTSSLLDTVARVVSCNPDTKPDSYLIGLEFITLRINRPKGTFISESA